MERLKPIFHLAAVAACLGGRGAKNSRQGLTLTTLENIPETMHFTCGTSTGCNGYAYEIVSDFAKPPSSGAQVRLGEGVVAPNEKAMGLAQKLVDELERDQTITSGYREGKGAHGRDGGDAFDFGHNTNSPRVPREEMEKAYYKVFDPHSSMAIEETGAYHFQVVPGRGGATGFLPGLRDKYGNPVPEF